MLAPGQLRGGRTAIIRHFDGKSATKNENRQPPSPATLATPARAELHQVEHADRRSAFVADLGDPALGQPAEPSDLLGRHALVERLPDEPLLVLHGLLQRIASAVDGGAV